MIPSSHVRAARCLKCFNVTRHERKGDVFVCECGHKRGLIESPLRMPPPVRFTKYLEGRYWDRVEVTPYCHIWTGDFEAKNPMIKSAGRDIMAKTLAWYFATGCWKRDGLWIIRSCQNVRCVNPEHLFEGTTKDWGALRSRAMQITPPKRPTHCKRGHKLVGDNVMKNGDKRCCYLCRLLTNRRHDAKQKIAEAAKRLTAKGFAIAPSMLEPTAESTRTPHPRFDLSEASAA